MELTINEKAEVQDFVQERIFQGSDEFNSIDLYAPFEDADIDFIIAFRLPDNTILGGSATPISMTFVSYDAETALGKWTLPLDSSYTEQWGYTKFSLYGKVVGSNKVLATPIIDYYVEESIDFTPTFT